MSERNNVYVYFPFSVQGMEREVLPYTKPQFFFLCMTYVDIYTSRFYVSLYHAWGSIVFMRDNTQFCLVTNQDSSISFIHHYPEQVQSVFIPRVLL
jgi:hypothetical protein